MLTRYPPPIRAHCRLAQYGAGARMSPACAGASASPPLGLSRRTRKWSSTSASARSTSGSGAGSRRMCRRSTVSGRQVTPAGSISTVIRARVASSNDRLEPCDLRHHVAGFDGGTVPATARNKRWTCKSCTMLAARRRINDVAGVLDSPRLRSVGYVLCCDSSWGVRCMYYVER